MERVCAAMAFDPGMFEHAVELIGNLQTRVNRPLDLCIQSLGLAPEQIQWLRGKNAHVRESYTDIPRFSDGPIYAMAMTCRPFLRDFFPGYDIYWWLDADLRLCHADAFDFYVSNARVRRDAIVIAQEVDGSYGFVNNPQIANFYHAKRNERIEACHGTAAADLLRYFNCFNAGIFAMHRDSSIWQRYAENIMRAIASPFHHMKEQDAMNLAIAQTGMKAAAAPSVMNWLCNASIPLFSTSAKRWVRPSYPHDVISVLHLSDGGATIPSTDGATERYIDFYKKCGLMRG